MVQPAEGDSVWHDRLPQRMAIGKDVTRFEKLSMTQTADGACLTVRAQYAVTESLLVHSAERERRYVGAASFGDARHIGLINS